MNLLNPTFRITRAMQAGLYYARRSNRARAAVQALTAWASGQTITAGTQRQSFGLAYQATTSGTTGATAPTGTSGNISDGGVTWQYLFSASLSVTP